MPKRDIIVIGASAGGVEALTALVAGLPADLPATVLVVLHVPSSSRSALPAILARVGKLPATHLTDDTPLRHGAIFVAPPDHHLTLRDDMIHLSRGPRINGHRPAIDPLFHTAARSARSRLIGVILSGALDDGTGGMAAIQAAGGATIVQDPKDALYASMPASVLEAIAVDHVLPAVAIGTTLGELAGRDVPDTPYTEADMASPDEDMETESDRLAARARRQGMADLAERYQQRYTDARQRAELIREVLERGRIDSDDGPVSEEPASGTADSENERANGANKG